MTIFIACAEADRASADQLEEALKRRAFLVERERPDRPGRPLGPMDALVVLWSQSAMMSAGRMMLERRAIEAWGRERLALVRLDAGLAPLALRDLPSVDASVAARRDFTWSELAVALREMTGPRAPPGAPARAPIEPPARSRSLFEWLRGRRREVPSAIPEAGAEAGAGAAPLFVSYASADKEAVLPAVDALEQGGLPIWIDRKGIRTGAGWAGEIVAAIRVARRVLVMCSARAFESPHVLREVYLAVEFRKPLLPVFLEEVAAPDDFLYHFAGVQALRLFELPDGERVGALSAAAAA